MTPTQRMIAMVITQLLGVALLATVGFGFLSALCTATGVDRKLEAGVNMIKRGFSITTLTLFVGILPGLILIIRKHVGPFLILGKQIGPFTPDDGVSATMVIFLFIDTLVVLGLVCQEGGLSRSMFAPIFFLIPIAHLAVERSDRMCWVYVTYGSIFVCLYVSYRVSRSFHCGTTTLPVLGTLTDFTTARTEYDKAVWIINLTAAFILGVQIYFGAGRAGSGA